MPGGIFRLGLGTPGIKRIRDEVYGEAADGSRAGVQRRKLY